MFPLLLRLHLSVSAFELFYRALPNRYISFPQKSAVQRLTSENGSHSLPLYLFGCLPVCLYRGTRGLHLFWIEFSLSLRADRLRHPPSCARPETEICRSGCFSIFLLTYAGPPTRWRDIGEQGNSQQNETRHALYLALHGRVFADNVSTSRMNDATVELHGRINLHRRATIGGLRV